MVRVTVDHCSPLKMGLGTCELNMWPVGVLRGPSGIQFNDPFSLWTISRVTVRIAQKVEICIKMMETWVFRHGE